MDDNTSLYSQFNTLIAADISEDEKLALIDSHKYYAIFSTVNTKEQHKLIYSYLQTLCIKHIITTRKISFFTDIFMGWLNYILKTHADIEAFFSFYTHKEIISIINYTEINHVVINYKKVQYTFILKTIITNNILYKYMKYYLEMHNIHMLIYKQPNNRPHVIHQRVIVDALIKYELKYKYHNSLRNTWIMACSSF